MVNNTAKKKIFRPIMNNIASYTHRWIQDCLKPWINCDRVISTLFLHSGDEFRTIGEEITFTKPQ